MSTMNSGLHCTISADMLHHLVEINFGSDTKVKKFGLLQGGLFNTTYRIQLEHTSYTDVILRWLQSGERWRPVLQVIPYFRLNAP